MFSTVEMWQIFTTKKIWKILLPTVREIVPRKIYSPIK